MIINEVERNLKTYDDGKPSFVFDKLTGGATMIRPIILRARNDPRLGEHDCTQL